MSDPSALEPELRRCFDEGRRAWPDLPLSPEAFASHLAARASSGEPLQGEHAADLYLACACAARVRGAVDAFERVHMGRVGGYLARMRPSPTFVDEVRQVVREKLFVGKDGASPKIGEYTGHGALASWLRVIALRAAIDLRRRGGDAVNDGGRAQADPASDDPELGYVKQRYRQAFNDAFRDAVRALAAEQRELLRLHFVEGRTLDQLATTFGVHRATIARKLAAARQAVAEEARRLLRTGLGASEAELASLAGMMQSQIDLSLPGLLKNG